MATPPVGSVMIRQSAPPDSMIWRAISDAKGRPIRMYLSSGQTSDYMGAAAPLSSLPQATTL